MKTIYSVMKDSDLDDQQMTEEEREDYERQREKYGSDD